MLNITYRTSLSTTFRMMQLRDFSEGHAIKVFIQRTCLHVKAHMGSGAVLNMADLTLRCTK